MEEFISKSQKKRDALFLRNIGVELINLSLKKLENLPLSPPLLQAIMDAKSIKSHGALRRQCQLIGKLMRNNDTTAILEAYEALQAEEEGQTACFHELEQWRSQLINGGNEALTAYIHSHPEVDIQQLKVLVKKAVIEQANNQATGASKALFRFLRTYVS